MDRDAVEQHAYRAFSRILASAPNPHLHSSTPIPPTGRVTPIQTGGGRVLPMTPATPVKKGGGRMTHVSGMGMELEGRMTPVPGMGLDLEGRMTAVPGIELNMEGRMTPVPGVTATPTRRKSSMRQRSKSPAPTGGENMDIKEWMEETFPLTYNAYKDTIEGDLKDTSGCKYMFRYFVRTNSRNLE